MKKPSGCIPCPFYQDGDNFVPPEGNPRNPWCVLESAGKIEGEQERPVVGPAGHEWEADLRAGSGRRRDQVYITNTIKCRPPKKAKPHEWTKAIACCRQYLDREVLDAGQGPSSVILFGSYALHGWLGTTIGRPDKKGKPQPPSITEWRGSLLRQNEWLAAHEYDRKVILDAHNMARILSFPSNPAIMPTLHPSHIIRGQWAERINVARDIGRALGAFPKRFNLLDPRQSAGLKPWDMVLDVETAKDDWRKLAIVGMLIPSYGIQQFTAIQRDRDEIQRFLLGRAWKIGQNLPFDAKSLIVNGFSIRLPLWDTITAAKLEEPDLDADLASIASRCLPDYFLWKGLPDWPALQRIFRAVYGQMARLDEVKVNLLDLELVDWWEVYNQVDLFQTARIKPVLEKRLAIPSQPGLPSRLDLFYRAYVPMAPRLIAMTEHGMRPVIPKFQATQITLSDELAQVAAEIMDYIEPIWEARFEPARQVAALLLAERDTMEAKARGGCPVHPRYTGLRKPQSKNCPECQAHHAAMTPILALHDAIKVRLSRAKAEAKRGEGGFKPSSPDHWRWLIYEHLKCPVKSKTETGEPSLDDDVLRLLSLDAKKRGLVTRHQALEWRLAYSKREHTLDSFVEPILTDDPKRRALDADGILRPDYPTYRTSIGRLSSGGSESEGGK